MLSAVCCLLSVVCCFVGRRLPFDVVCGSLLTVGCWLLVVGCGLFAVCWLMFVLSGLMCVCLLCVVCCSYVVDLCVGAWCFGIR